ncbi:MAG TPA: hypothetical protein DCX54_07435 [Flavobacteriales bacterium]|nr:hypothetical protein [Flavobacteriales bacterium]
MFKLISFLFHPFSFLLLGTFILFNTHTYINFSYSNELKLLVYAVIFLNTMLLPVLISWYWSKKGRISSILMEQIADRKKIYLITFGFYLATLFVLSSFGVPVVIYKYALGAGLTVGALFILAMLNKKLSAHLSAIGGLCGALVMLSFRLQTDLLTLIAVFVILAGIIATARIQVKAHNESEVYLGFLLGFFTQVFIFS